MTETAPVDDAASTGAPIDSGIVGTWVGYLDRATFSSGSDRVEIRVTNVAVDGTIAGTVAFGEPGMLPPPTGPDAAYPEASDGFPKVFEAFAYSLAGTYDEAVARLDVTIHLTELWAEWCLLQTPYAIEDGLYWCVPNCGFMSNGTTCTLPCEEPLLVSCAKLQLCESNVCACTASGCVHDSEGWPVTLDLHRDGSEMQGPIDFLGTAYLVRQ